MCPKPTHWRGMFGDRDFSRHDTKEAHVVRHARGAKERRFHEQPSRPPTEAGNKGSSGVGLGSMATFCMECSRTQ